MLMYLRKLPFSFLCLYFSVLIATLNFVCLPSSTLLGTTLHSVIEPFVAFHFVLAICFVSSSSCYSPTKNFFNKGFVTSPKSGAAAETSSPIGSPFPLCPLFVLFLNLLPPLCTKHLFLQIVFLSFQQVLVVLIDSKCSVFEG